jgi:hypothetical protein
LNDRLRALRTLLCALLIVAACLVVFAPAFSAGITNWDDGSYLQASPLSPFVMGNFHPLTMLTFALTGQNPFVLHATNIALHCATAVVLFLLLRELSGSVPAACAGALLWAVHPLRTEPVAWIADRVDLLCGLFYTAALLAYVRQRRWLTVLLFLLALLSKAMAVTFPLALLAIDFLQGRRALREKAPFFALSVVFGIVGLVARRGPGALPVLPGFAFSPLAKIALSCRALLLYLGNLLFPLLLSAVYAYPKALTWNDWLAPLFVAAVAAIAWWSVRLTRTIAFAFLFFLVSIAIVLPVVSIGHTFAADRYTYIPSIGFAYAVAMLLKHIPRASIAAAAAAVLLGVMSFQRTQVWHDSVSLWSSVIDADPDVAMAYNNRAAALTERHDVAAAVRDIDRALALDPCYDTALRNRTIAAVSSGDQATARRLALQHRRCQAGAP